MVPHSDLNHREDDLTASLLPAAYARLRAIAAGQRRRLPVDTLKIDQSFVRDMLSDPDDRAIVKGVISLALSFSLDVVAEGVETTEQGDLLLDMGCDMAQGYGIARPMPAEKFADWCARWQSEGAWRTLNG